MSNGSVENALTQAPGLHRVGQFGRLLDILHQRIEGELDEESLQRVTVTDLKTAFASADGEEDGDKAAGLMTGSKNNGPAGETPDEGASED